MSMEMNTVILLGGFLLNGLLTAGALFRFALSNERRMTRMETLIEHLAPRSPHRRTDEATE